MRSRRDMWHPRFDKTFELLRAVHGANSRADICDHLLAYASRIGATHLLAGAIPPPQSSRRMQLEHIILDAWPLEWSRRYFSRGYLCSDPTIEIVRRGKMSFFWSEVDELCEVYSSGRRVMEEARDFSLCQGITFSFVTLDAGIVGFSFAGKKLETDPLQTQSLHLIAAYACCCAMAVSDRTSVGPPPKLTDRQRDVLLWASEGLKVEAIAERLGISSHTADTHLRLVRDKLGATNSIHAVAQALRLGLIE